MKLGKIVLGGVALVVTAASFGFRPHSYSGGNLYTKTGTTCTLKSTCHTDVSTGTRACLNGITAYTTSTCTASHVWTAKTKSVL